MKMTFDAFSPQEVIEAISKAGTHKGNMRLDKVLFSSVSAGCLLAFACGTTLSTTTAPWFQDNAPGLIRTIGAMVFPYGLCMILLTSADLCTGSFMVWKKQIRWPWWRPSTNMHTSLLQWQCSIDACLGRKCWFIGLWHSSATSLDLYLSWLSSSAVRNPLSHPYYYKTMWLMLDS